MDTQYAMGKCRRFGPIYRQSTKAGMQGAGTPLLAIQRRNGGAHPIGGRLVDGVEGSAKAPFIMGCRGAGTRPDWRCNGHALRWHIPPLPQSAPQISDGMGDGCVSRQRDATGERSVSLAKISGNTPDILQSALDACLA